MTVGAVSQRITALEQYFEATLIVRTVNGVKLTEEGKVVFDFAEEMLHKLSYSKTEVQEMQKSPRGMVRIEASTIPGDHIIPAIISGFKDKYPGVNFLIKVSDTQVAFDHLLNGSVDFAAVGSLMLAPKELELEKILIGKENLVVIVHPNHRLASKKSVDPAELYPFKFISREKGSGTRIEVARVLEEAGVEIPVHLQLGSTESIITAVSEGDGLSIISEIAASKAKKAGLVETIDIRRVRAAREFYLVRDKKRTPPKSSRLFWEYCRDLQKSRLTIG